MVQKEICASCNSNNIVMNGFTSAGKHMTIFQKNYTRNVEMNGEWFNLNSSDIKAFKRWQCIV